MENSSFSGNFSGNHTVEVAAADDDSYFSSFPAGIRFMPTDVELIVYYLGKKIFDEPLPPNQIVEIELYKFHPQELTQFRTQGEGEWYFFTPRERKYPNGNRPARAASTGYWKATGADKGVLTDDNVHVGYKQSLVFYEGKPPGGVKTNWMMHEYRVHNPPQRQKAGPHDMRLDDWVLCKIYEKGNRKRRYVEENNEEDNSSGRRQQIESSDTVEDVATAEGPQNDNGFLDPSGDFDYTRENHENDNRFLDSNGDFDHTLDDYQIDYAFLDVGGNSNHVPEDYQNDNGFLDPSGDNFDHPPDNYQNNNDFLNADNDAGQGFVNMDNYLNHFSDKDNKPPPLQPAPSGLPPPL